MNKTAIKNFAVWARTKLRDDIKIRAGFLGINEDGIATPLPASTQEIKYFEVGSAQPIALSGEKLRGREKIVEKLQKKASETDYKTAYDLMVETYASDWFNRFVALRFMEVNERFSDNMRVLSSSNPDRHDPDIVSQPFSSELEFTDKERADITEWKTKNETDKLFRFLLIKKCNQLSKVLPGLFEEAGDESELMMRQSFIDKDGVIYRLVNDIDEEDWKDQVQIIGWLYQYYNSDPKSEVDKKVKKGGKVSKFEVPAKTQLFTTDWIVRYMVENALGSMWVQGHLIADNVNTSIEFDWKYYLPEVNQENSTKELLNNIRKDYSKLNPEDITFIDPSMGSGHILAYAFDIFVQIYESVGYTRRDAVRSIVENNLYGLDIDDRAYQLAYFAIMMKACEYDGRFLERGVRPHVYSIQESNGINRNQLRFFGANLSDIEKNNAINQVTGLLDTFIDAKEYGSILNVDNYEWGLLNQFVDGVNDAGQMTMETVGIDETQKRLKRLIEIGEIMSSSYWITCTNPPYMKSSYMSTKLSAFAEKNYPITKGDLFAMFMERGMGYTKKNGIMSMITMQSWMFLSSYLKLRNYLVNYDLLNLLHLGKNAFEEIGGEVVQTVAFGFRKSHIPEYISLCDRLKDIEAYQDKEPGFLSGKHRHLSKKTNFEKIPAKPYAYWISAKVLESFSFEQCLGDRAEIVSGMTTGNNEAYLRGWVEVDYTKIAFDKKNICDVDLNLTKWIPYHKGGEQRKWYGNREHLVNWSESGNFNRAKTTMTHVYLQPCVTWSDISGTSFAGRYCDGGFLFDVKGSCAFGDIDNLKLLMGVFNSIVTPQYIEALNPTTTTQVGDLKRIPFKSPCGEQLTKVRELVDANISISKSEWDSFELSWDFARHPLVPSISTDNSKKIEWCFENWKEVCEERFTKLKNNEEELNRIFIDTYGLQDELSPEEQDCDVTLRKADLIRDIKSLISYAVGCILGRYSLDKEGLVYAGGNWDASEYVIFKPDEDNIVPITDARYMNDDLVDRFCEWIETVYGDENLEENLSFIAKALGTKGTDSRDVLRNYFLNDFFKDHCQTYSVTGFGKRPIYWMFDSGNQNAFKAIVYMHRIDADTIGRVRISYLHPLQEKYENEVRSIDNMIQGMTDQRKISAEEKRRETLVKQIAEIKEYDEKLDHLAQERIEIDLDDGVKVNYEKIQTDRDGKKYQILAPIK